MAWRRLDVRACSLKQLFDPYMLHGNLLVNLLRRVHDIWSGSNYGPWVSTGVPYKSVIPLCH
jgi:hypothetical protein